jgi:hypothetical protein
MCLGKTLFKGWLGDKFEDESSDDESIMNPVFAMNDKRNVAASTTVQVPLELSDDDAELSHHSKVSKSTMPSR